MRNHLRILANRADGDAEIIADSEEGRENYDDRLVRVGGKSVVCKSKDIATASIEKAGVVSTLRHSVRAIADSTQYKSVVVYINEKGILDDIVKSGADAWHQGTLAKSNFKAVPDSPITCVYNTSISAKASKELFKVFYYKADTPLNAPWVAWWNGEKWQSEAVISTN